MTVFGWGTNALNHARLIFFICSSQNPAFDFIRFGLRRIKRGIFWTMRASPYTVLGP